MHIHTEEHRNAEDAIRLPVGLDMFYLSANADKVLLQIKIAVRGSLFANFCLAVLQSKQMQITLCMNLKYDRCSVCRRVLPFAIPYRNRNRLSI
jgi:hypothetical protein